jgi:7,8-dihydroneopterin aldolase/epimerase/oxygenase
MDETSIAFELPHVRAAATQTTEPLDRISVRDYVRPVEIGAFRAERGVAQRIRFNVVLEVAHHVAAMDDDVDKVISYDTITEAIEAQLAVERINLLETLAERVAQRCLADPRAVRVFVRIEKLDRIPGALGVEIARSRPDAASPRLRSVAAGIDPPAPRPWVVHLSAAALAGEGRAGWLQALGDDRRPWIVCVEPLTPQRPASGEAALRIGLLAIEQNAWSVAGTDPGLVVTGARTEIDWALKTGRLPVWAPAKMITDAIARPEGVDASRPAALAAWLAEELDAAAVVLAGEVADAAPDAVPVRRLPPREWGTLAQLT